MAKKTETLTIRITTEEKEFIEILSERRGTTRSRMIMDAVERSTWLDEANPKVRSQRELAERMKLLSEDISSLYSG